MHARHAERAKCVRDLVRDKLGIRHSQVARSTIQENCLHTPFSRTVLVHKEEPHSLGAVAPPVLLQVCLFAPPLPSPQGQAWREELQTAARSCVNRPSSQCSVDLSCYFSPTGVGWPGS